MKILGWVFFTFITLSFFASCDSKQNSSKDTSEADSNAVVEKVIPDKYCNDKYEYCISFPKADFAIDDTKSGEEGAIITSGDNMAQIDVHIGNRDATIKGGIDKLKDAYDADRTPNGRKISSQSFSSTYYTIIGVENRTLFYQKTIISKGEIVTAVFSYDNDVRDTYYPMIEPIFKSFKWFEK